MIGKNRLNKAIAVLALLFVFSLGMSTQMILFRQPIVDAAPDWLPLVHAARLRDWGALDYVDRYLNYLIVGDTPWYGWVEVETGIVRFQEFGNEAWFTAALIHEAAHVQMYENGLQYYGSQAEAMADAITMVFYPDWGQRHPDDIPDNGPVGGNPPLGKK